MTLARSEQIRLARHYEPILYFHPDERFFPCDPKRYLEHASLWRTRSPAATQDDWGEQSPGVFPKHPLAAAGGISAVDDPAEPPHHTWLGHLLPPPGHPEQDRFLSLADWRDSAAVTATTENRESDLDELAQRYQDNADLRASRFWYYAEVLDSGDLSTLVGQAPTIADFHNLSKVLALLDTPRLVLYHLFYPAHEEPLEGCEAFGQQPQFASYGGEWACVAVLEQHGAPTHIGLTRRNTGSLDVPHDDERIGMVVGDWDSVHHPSLLPNTAEIAVAHGTHGMYLDVDRTEARPVDPFTSELQDLGRAGCGSVEHLDKALDTAGGSADEPPHNSVVPVEAALLKLAAGLVAGLFFPAFVLADAEAIAAASRPFGTYTAPSEPVDRTPTPDEAGVVIAPREAPAAGPSWHPWRTDPQSAPDGLVPGSGGRTYSFLVDRTTQIWWPTRDETQGYDGRWGPNVADDPRSRRSGMRLPEFWLMFLRALL